MSPLTNSRTVLSRLGRLLLHRYKPGQPPPVPRYTHHIHTAARGSRSDVLDSIGGLFARHVGRVAAYRTPPPPVPRYTHHIHTAAWGSRSEVLDSIRGLFSRHVRRVAAYRTPPPPLSDSCSRNRLPTPSRRWYRNPRKVAAAVLLPCAAGFAALGALSHHETVPYTNRAHRVILSPSNERELGDVIFDDIKKELGDNVLDSSDPQTVRVRLIADDIIRGVHRALPTKSPSDSGSSSYNDASSVTDDMWVNERQKQGKAAVQPQTGHLGDLKWEVVVVKDDYVMAYFDPSVAAGVYEKLGEIGGDSAWYDYIGSHPSCKKRSRLLSRGKAIEGGVGTIL